MDQQTQINDKNLTNIDATNKYNADKRAQTLTNQRAILSQVGELGTINKVYSDMSGNNATYDFTTKDENGQPILFSLAEDRTLTTALIKDNATYLAEQNNLYVVGTLTMATLLVAAILISK
jgi:hypothetical protein